MEITLFYFFVLINISIPLVRCQFTSFSTGGQWRLLRRSIGISAMHMQLLHNNQVVMFDRTDFGRSNLSLPFGRCRHDTNDTALETDCTAHSVLYDIRTNDIRPLMVQTDTFCSCGAVLSDGTLAQFGGFNDGERVIRTLTPCIGNYNCDWIEYPGSLHERRWYATNQVLPDGRVIIVGGRRQFNYEFYPRSSGNASENVYWLDFLRQTTDQYFENNLYPFLHLLPDGNLFIFANTRSILFDYIHNRIIREFRAIPGNDPRNYPSSGSSVLLPIRSSEEEPRATGAEVLICGGAPQGSSLEIEHQNYVSAVSTCGRLQVTDPDPHWEMERMPMPRVMSDMLILPTGNIVIINGARSGTAGWEKGRDPVTTPLIYNPYGPINARFSAMNPSLTPRMYHSTAVLLPDGRVLVGGSNPHPNYNFTNVRYPTELSLAAFSPPYLAPQYDHLRPKITLSSEIIRYGQITSVTFKVQEYRSVADVSVNIIAPSFTTHSLAMNQRMVLLRVMAVRSMGLRTYEVSALAPAVAEIAPSGYYLMFVVHRGTPSSGVWVKLKRD